MRTILIISAFLSASLSVPLLAVDFPDLASQSPKDAKAKARGNWFLGLGVTHQLASNNFECSNGCTQANEGIRPDDAINLFGGEFRAGRELAIANKLSLILSLDITYAKNKDTGSIKPTDKTVDVFVNQDSVTTEYLGFGGSVGLAVFPFKIKNIVIVPVVEFGFSSGSSKKSINYYYNDILNVDEAYYEKVEQSYTQTRFGAGVNIIASSGIYSYVRIFATNIDFETESAIRYEGTNTGFTGAGNQTPLAPTTNETPLMVVLGFGYRF